MLHWCSGVDGLVFCWWNTGRQGVFGCILNISKLLSKVISIDIPYLTHAGEIWDVRSEVHPSCTFVVVILRAISYHIGWWYIDKFIVSSVYLIEGIMNSGNRLCNYSEIKQVTYLPAVLLSPLPNLEVIYMGQASVSENLRNLMIGSVIGSHDNEADSLPDALHICD